MKKLILKIITISLSIVTLLSFTACTYRKDGSVVQDVTFNVSYELDGEAENIGVTLSFYKTFAPKTCDHLLSYIKNGGYENTSLVMEKGGAYFVLGAFNYANGKYEEVIYSGDTVEGEFKSNGWNPRLKAEAGSLVLLREPDTGKGSPKYDTGKASIAIILEDTTLTNQYYTVFGKIDGESLEELQELALDTLYDDENDILMRYIGDRNEDSDLLTVENNKYVGGLEYYLGYSSQEIKDLNKVKIEEESEPGVENELYKKLSSVNALDVFALPTTNIKVSDFKIK